MSDDNKKAIITGIGGQDGYYLTKFLIRKSYRVYGLTRDNISTLKKLSNDLEIQKALEKSQIHILKSFDYNPQHLFDVISHIKPDEIYNLACQSNVVNSYNLNDFKMVDDVSILTKIILTVQKNGLNSKILQASSSEIYGGNNSEKILTEFSRLSANSPYGLAKIYNHELIKYYRLNHSFFGCNAILFNHESVLRPENFALKKITKGLVSILKKQADHLTIENLDTVRDWGHAAEYCEAMWRIINHNKPDDFIVATGVSASVREILDFVFSNYGLNYEKFILLKPNKNRLFNKPKIYADVSKINNEIKWKAKLNWRDLVNEMIEFEMKH